MLNQKTLEYYFHPKHIKNAIIDELKRSIPNELTTSVNHIKQWIAEPDSSVYTYQTKQLIKDYPLYDIVIDIIATVCMHANTPIPYISIASMIKLDNLTKKQSILMISQMLAIISQIPYYTLNSDGKYKPYYIKSNLILPQIIQDRLKHACYLPPMIEKPDTINTNYTSGYQTFNDSVILGFTENSHNQPLALDVLNTLNQTQYILDEYVLNNFTKPWHRQELTHDEVSLLHIDDQNKYHIQKQTFDTFKGQFDVMTKHFTGKTLYFTHKYDKRGRVYAQGYHFNPQGTSFEKACISLKNQELVTGEL